MKLQITLLMIALLFLAGCASKEFLSLEEDMITEDGSVTEDPVEIAEMSEESLSKEEALDAFVSFWRKEKYEVIYDLISDHQGLEVDEFVFLVDNSAEAEQIQNISIDRREGNFVKFKIFTKRYMKKIPTQFVKSNKGWLLEPFYIFDGLDPVAVCGARAEAVTLGECGLTVENPDKTRCKFDKRQECFYDYAQVSGDYNYCNLTGSMKGPCLISLGFEIDINQTIVDCYAFPRESEQAGCLLELAKSTGYVDICRQTVFERTKYTCYGVMAANDGSVLKCNSYIRNDGFYNSYRHALCVLSYVKQTGDDSKCSAMLNDDNSMIGALKEECSKLGW